MPQRPVNDGHEPRSGLRIAGEPHIGMHWTAALLLSWPVLLVLLGGVIAPWALDRVRHS